MEETRLGAVVHLLSSLEGERQSLSVLSKAVRQSGSRPIPSLYIICVPSLP